MMLAIIVFTMCYAAGVRARHMLIATVPALLFVGNMLIFTPFRMRRLVSIHGSVGRRAGHGLSGGAVADCRRFGWSEWTRVRAGQQKILFLPFAHSDFIFAVIGEELGLIGALIVVIVFAVFLWRGMRASLLAPDRFGMLLGIGHRRGHCRAGALNISVVLSLLPTKGIPLPFISYGGSSLVPTLAAVGILLNISQYAGRGSRTAYDDGDYEEDWQPARQRRKKRPVRQRAVARAR